MALAVLLPQQDATPPRDNYWPPWSDQSSQLNLMNTSGVKWAVAGISVLVLLLVRIPSGGSDPSGIPLAIEPGPNDPAVTPTSSQRPNLQSGVWRKATPPGEEPSPEELEATIHLTRAQAEAFLAKKGRNGTTLLAAFYATEDRSYLEEALKNHSDDPKVVFIGMSRNKDDKERSLQLLERFKQVAPSNSLAFYLSAQNQLAAGKVQEALRDLQTGSQLAAFDNYGLERMRGVEDIYASTGLPPGEAKSQAMQAVELTHLGTLKSLINKVVDVQKQYREVGEQDQANALLQQGLQLAGRLNRQDSGTTLIENLVGMAVENILLKPMDPDAVLPGSDLKVSERQQLLKDQKRLIREELLPAFQSYLKSATDEQKAAYLEQVWTTGEQAAMESITETTRAGIP